MKLKAKKKKKNKLNWVQKLFNLLEEDKDKHHRNLNY